MTYQFPQQFQWGVATSAYQIEGAVEEEGRRPSVWDRFSQHWCHIKDRSSGAIACDHYHRYTEDVGLIRQLGAKHYRFSTAWSRIVPEGRGAVNAQGLAFYDRLVDCLLEQGIEPVITLFHWDSPQALEDRYGSWRSREMAQDFADYAAIVVRALGDRVTRWITLNEISCFTHLGYAVGKRPEHAPGTRVSTWKEVWQTSHHALLAHGLGCQAIRAASPQPCQVALVDNPGVTVPIVETETHIRAAQRALPDNFYTGGILYPALTGNYHPEFLVGLGNNAPDIQPSDLEIIHQPIDFLGLNIYTGAYVRAADNAKGYEFVAIPKGYPKLHMPWLQVVPESLYWGVRHIRDTLQRPDLPIWITESGCAADDTLTPAGEVWDTDRIFYLRQSLKAVHRAIGEGYPVQGYFLWSLLDNFEWSWGYSRRFGITYVDYKTQARIPKASFDWYAACIAANQVL
ncbi:GH1 family beta-glucosidase [Alkalinema sp. FACHB-956]|uniref:GH1 family beta-glucosidase n=1 Tax=Alkalinema sp. FACHB-956 TaxID=2692768 RepID=UPI001684BB1A|nr:GH1 family beta-glucosidase [Alkalinema sp. FACHB-956]MBD2325391.1 beta-glucosidase [Alkalinema sp. FACHB-956]